MRLTLVVTTYERPDALEAVLRSVAAQAVAPHETLVADDGSGPATAEVIARLAAGSMPNLRHVRQEHEGFRLTRLRNLAIAAASSDYLVFVDGDMVLHPQFVADHARTAAPGFYTQGIRIQLDAQRTAQLIASPQELPGPMTSGLGALRRVHALHSTRLSRITRRLGNRLVSTKGCNQGFWRRDLIAVNGFDEQIVGWGPEDKELCARLVHAGVHRQTLMFGGIAFHLEHPPASRTRRDENDRILQQTLRERRRRCERGLDAHPGNGIPQPLR